MIRCGCRLRNSSVPSPCLSSWPSRKFSRNTSAVSSSLCMVSRSSAFSMSSTTLRLPRLNSGKNAVPMPPRERVLSPEGGSTLITSAPNCARIMPQVGPMTMWVISTMRTPSSGNPVSVMHLSPVRSSRRLGLHKPSEKYNLSKIAFALIERFTAMDSRQLRYFIAVYEQRNLSRAADQVNVAQSALSHHISNLEAEFATPLFERKPRGMEPTAAGERLYEHARIILRAMAEAETEVREGARVIAGDISIGMANSGVKAIGIELMRTVLTKYPKLKLSLTESLSGATLMHLMISSVDLALVYNPPSEKELITEPVLEEEMFCVGIPKLVGKGKAPIRFEELSRMRLILLRYGLGLSSRALLDDPVLLKRLEGSAILHANSITGMTGALVEGLGCTIATKLFAREELAAGRLVAREVIEPKLTRTLYLCRLRNRPMTYAMEEMRRRMLALVAEQVRNGGWQATLAG